jgi:hypothetical protein
MALALKFETKLRNNRLDQIEAFASNSTAGPLLAIFTGTIPADCQAANGAGTLLCTMDLAQNCFQVASGGVIQANTTTPWTNSSAGGTGTAAWFRMYSRNNTGGWSGNVVMQGTVGTSASDMIIDNTSINAGQQVTVTSFQITDGNA